MEETQGEAEEAARKGTGAIAGQDEHRKLNRKIKKTFRYNSKKLPKIVHNSD